MLQRGKGRRSEQTALSQCAVFVILSLRQACMKSFESSGMLLAVQSRTCGAQPMSTRKTVSELPAGLERTRRRLDRWLETRKVRSRIPESLWSSAVRMPRTYDQRRFTHC